MLCPRVGGMNHNRMLTISIRNPLINPGNIQRDVPKRRVLVNHRNQHDIATSI